MIIQALERTGCRDVGHSKKKYNMQYDYVRYPYTGVHASCREARRIRKALPASLVRQVGSMPNLGTTAPSRVMLQQNPDGAQPAALDCKK